MKNLGKDIERIKQMMKTINEGSFNEPTESEVPLDVRQKSTKIINNFIQNPDIDDYRVSSSDGLFSIAGEPVGDTQYILNYNFDIDYTQHSTDDDNAEYELDITSVELIKGVTNLNDEYSDEVIYNGDDFTGIMDIKLSNGETASDFIINIMDESIQDEERDLQSGREPDYERDDEPDYGPNGNPADDYINESYDYNDLSFGKQKNNFKKESGLSFKKKSEETSDDMKDYLVDYALSSYSTLSELEFENESLNNKLFKLGLINRVRELFNSPEKINFEKEKRIQARIKKEEEEEEYIWKRHPERMATNGKINREITKDDLPLPAGWRLGYTSKENN
jgi:hypothetical protein